MEINYVQMYQVTVQRAFFYDLWTAIESVLEFLQELHPDDEDLITEYTQWKNLVASWIRGPSELGVLTWSSSPSLHAKSTPARYESVQFYCQKPFFLDLQHVAKRGQQLVDEKYPDEETATRPDFFDHMWARLEKAILTSSNIIHIGPLFEPV